MQYEVAHAAGRDRWIEPASDVKDWVDAEFTKVYGPNFDYFRVQPEPKVATVGHVVHVLNEIGDQHPTLRVRDSARDLASNLAGFYGEMYVEHRNPSEDRFRLWSAKASDLIELIHVR
jgi:hypothetical protein